MDVRDGVRQGWYEAPSASSGRGVVIIHEILGVNDDMRRVARLFAEQGYHALVPRLFRSVGCLVRTMREVSSGPASGDVADEVDAWRAWLAREHGAEAAAICGFCLGGSYALALAARGDGLPVAAAHYGAAPGDVSRSCPVVASYGERDNLFREHGVRLAQELSRAGIDHDVKVYPGVGHSFMVRYSGWQELFARIPGPMAVGYDEAVAEDAWKWLFAFFDQHLS